MCGQLGTAGFAFADSAEDADVLLINTCGFIEPACREARQEVEMGVEWRKQRPGRRLVVAGCWVQRYGAQVRENYPEIDLLLDLNAVPESAERIAALFRLPAPAADSSSKYRARPPAPDPADQSKYRARPPAPDSRHAAPAADSLSGKPASFLADEHSPRLLLTPPDHGYLKIAEGCAHGCRFCTIPSIRGALRSRPVESLVAEAQTLLDCGVCEINLIAQDTTQYGRDRNDGATLPALLRALDPLTADEYWLRLLYTHPAHFSDEIIETLRNGVHIVPYIDIPLQHISDSVLHAMGRRTPAADIRALLSRLRERIPGVALRTTFLVGYPGETDADFAELLDFVRDMRFERLGCFPFYPEVGTPAARLHAENPVPTEVAEERRDQLMLAQQTIALENNQALVGKTLDVLVEGQSEDGDILARSAMDAPDVDDRVLLPPDSTPAVPHFLRVRVTQAGAYDLAAEPVEEGES